MSRTTIMDKERLAAFADGDLPPEEAAAVVMHLADHPGDQAYVDDIMAANIALARAFNAPMTEGVPDRFANLILPKDADDQVSPASNVIPLRSRVARKPWVAGAMTAGVALAAAVAAVVILPHGDAGLRVGPVPVGSSLHKILTATPSGKVVRLEDAGELMVLSSLPASEGFCREFEVVSTAPEQIQLGLACQASGGWTVDVLLAEAHATATDAPDSFSPASGDAVSAMDLWLERRGAGAALTPTEEGTLMARGWVR